MWEKGRLLPSTAAFWRILTFSWALLLMDKSYKGVTPVLTSTEVATMGVNNSEGVDRGYWSGRQSRPGDVRCSDLLSSGWFKSQQTKTVESERGTMEPETWTIVPGDQPVTKGPRAAGTSFGGRRGEPVGLLQLMKLSIDELAAHYEPALTAGLWRPQTWGNES